MTGKDSYIAFFDIDHTLIRANSGEVMIRQAYRQKLMSTRDILRGIYYSLAYKLHLKKTDDIITGMANWLAGVSHRDIKKLAKDIFENQLKPLIYPQLAAELDKHRRQGGRLVLLTAAMHEIGSLFQDQLNFDDCECSHLEVKDGYFTGRPLGQFCFGDQKRERLLQYCHRQGVEPASCYYYADAWSDRSALAAVGKAVCINPETRLRKLALASGWTIYSW